MKGSVNNDNAEKVLKHIPGKHKNREFGGGVRALACGIFGSI